jgi:hypothetical protein
MPQCNPDARHGGGLLMAWTAKLLATGLLAWLGLLATIIILGVLRGDIRNRGMLIDHSRGEIIPERLVMMAVFPFVLLGYIVTALSFDPLAAIDRPSLPDVPESLLALLTGGNGLYLVGKIARAVK